MGLCMWGGEGQENVVESGGISDGREFGAQPFLVPAPVQCTKWDW